MKRSGLNRRSPLKRSRFRRDHKPLTTADKEAIAEEAKLALRFHDEALRYAPYCENCWSTKDLEVHHVIRQQFIRAQLRKLGLEHMLAALWDCRNAFVACRDCHAGHTNRSRPIGRAKLRTAHWEFAREWDKRVGTEAFTVQLESYPE